MKKRIAALLLTLTMLVTFMPAMAFAAEEPVYGYSGCSIVQGKDVSFKCVSNEDGFAGADYYLTIVKTGENPTVIEASDNLHKNNPGPKDKEWITKKDAFKGVAGKYEVYSGETKGALTKLEDTLYVYSLVCNAGADKNTKTVYASSKSANGMNITSLAEGFDKKDNTLRYWVGTEGSTTKVADLGGDVFVPGYWGGYSKTVYGYWTPKGKPINVEGVKANNKVYDGTTDVVLDTTEMKVNGVADGDNITVKVTGKAESKDAKKEVKVILSYEITGPDALKYEMAKGPQKELKIEITRKPVTVKADNKTQYAGEQEKELTATVTGTLGIDTVEYKLKREPGTAVGTYKITAEGKKEQGNYEVTFVEGVYTISEKPAPPVPTPEPTDPLKDAKVAAEQAVLAAAGGELTGELKMVFDKAVEVILAADTEAKVADAQTLYVKMMGTTKAVNAVKVVQLKPGATKKGIYVKFNKADLVAADDTTVASVQYEIKRAINKKFTKKVKNYTKKSGEKAKVTFKNAKKLKKGRKYYFKVRGAVTFVDGTVVHTEWSKTKAIKAKKSKK